MRSRPYAMAGLDPAICALLQVRRWPGPIAWEPFARMMETLIVLGGVIGLAGMALLALSVPPLTLAYVCLGMLASGFTIGLPAGSQGSSPTVEVDIRPLRRLPLPWTPSARPW